MVVIGTIVPNYVPSISLDQFRRMYFAIQLLPVSPQLYDPHKYYNAKLDYLQPRIYMAIMRHGKAGSILTRTANGAHGIFKDAESFLCRTPEYFLRSSRCTKVYRPLLPLKHRFDENGWRRYGREMRTRMKSEI